MTGIKPRSVLTRLASLEEARDAANGNWHELTNLWSIQNDIDWLLRVAEQARLTSQWAGAIGSGPIEELDADLEALFNVLRSPERSVCNCCRSNDECGDCLACSVPLKRDKEKRT